MQRLSVFYVENHRIPLVPVDRDSLLSQCILYFPTDRLICDNKRKSHAKAMLCPPCRSAATSSRPHRPPEKGIVTLFFWSLSVLYQLKHTLLHVNRLVRPEKTHDSYSQHVQNCCSLQKSMWLWHVRKYFVSPEPSSWVST